ncbi:MAG: zinc ribbon domain-containing protein [Chloroflexota bacterium]|nr:MAG: zinc ribbon domain-containing protein [Chloroflexota bacterium]
MRECVLLLIALLPLLVAVRSLSGVIAVQAEEAAPKIKRITVSIFPEYDEPRVLATYEGEFEDSQSFPMEVHFRVPKGADVREACAIQPPENEHLCQLFKTRFTGDDTLVTYSIPSPTFFLEFYFGDRASARNLEYTFRFDNPVEHLDLVVQHPLRASDFTIAPAGSAVSDDGKGFLYHRFARENIRPSQSLQVKVAYQKDDQEPSVPKKLTAISPGPQGDQRKDWILLGAGLLLTALVAAGIYALIDRLGGGPVVVVRSPRTDNEADGRPDGFSFNPHERLRFCTICGERLPHNASVCPGCGASTRQSTDRA